VVTYIDALGGEAAIDHRFAATLAATVLVVYITAAAQIAAAHLIGCIKRNTAQVRHLYDIAPAIIGV
jgi:hypothetical protein